MGTVLLCQDRLSNDTKQPYVRHRSPPSSCRLSVHYWVAIPKETPAIDSENRQLTSKIILTDQATTEKDSKILRYIEQTPMNYFNDIYAKSYKVADVYDKSTTKDVFIAAADPFICRSVRKYCATHPPADDTDTAIQTKSQLALKS